MMFYEEGKKLYYLDEDDRAIDLFTKSKHPNRFYYLGNIMILENLYKEAFVYYQNGADLDDADCQSELCRMYYLAIEVKQDFDKAIHYGNLAVSKGNKNAIWLLGNIYYALKKYEDALHWYNKIELEEYPDITFRLSTMYFNGLGVEINNSLGIYYLEVAASFGDITAYSELATRYKLGDGIEQNISKAIEYFTKLLGIEHPTASIELGVIYMTGFDVEIDEKKAFEYFSGDFESSMSLYWVGQCYMDGIGVVKDYNKAVECFLKGIQIDDQYGICTSNYNALGICYLFGLGVDVDVDKAVEYFLKENDKESYTNIGQIYFDGTNVPKDYKKAFEYFELALEHGSTKAYKYLADMYEHGYHVEIDLDIANEYRTLDKENN